MEEKIFDTIVLGGGPAGYTAALYAARAGLSVVVLEMLSPGGQMATTTRVENYPGFPGGIDGFTLGEQMQAGAEAFGASTEYVAVTALRLDQNPKQIETTGGIFLCRSLIYAAGATPRNLGLPGEEALVGRGVAYCATCDGAFFKGKTVAVVGGGNSAAEDALLLSQLCRTVYLVHRRDRLRAGAVYQRRLEGAQNLQFLWNAQPEALIAGDRLTALGYLDLSTGQHRELAVDGVFVAIGRAPNTDLVKGQLTLDSGGYLVADETTQTNLPGVFAAGDVRTKPFRQIVTAAADGAVAAKYAESYVRALH